MVNKIKQLLWPHEYATPIGWLRYHTNRCESGEHCWRRATHDEPEVVCRACDLHVDAPVNRLFARLREVHKRRSLVDPLFRLETEYEYDSLRKAIRLPVHSVWWRAAHIGRNRP